MEEIAPIRSSNLFMEPANRNRPAKVTNKRERLAEGHAVHGGGVQLARSNSLWCQTPIEGGAPRGGYMPQAQEGRATPGRLLSRVQKIARKEKRCRVSTSPG